MMPLNPRFMHGQDQMASTYREGEYEKMTTARFASEIMNAIVRANRSVLKNSLPKTGFELNAGRSGVAVQCGFR
ncbi:hypothetical protein L914_05680 [Phytophthora nicotianae]|uniref:Uncharacterized protein n=1 Tax=Phytophthora nicotianae TaxID=4792 RepID=W2JBW9_PHYNI|nr:hypothetical protein L916_05678 [Phytophthora nicotianae]ETM50245.1 hypothetical protein L914_05680 [Phytophthora nicotianae]